MSDGHASLAFITFLICLVATESLDLLELRVPPHVPLSSRTHLICRWQLSPAEHLYSVKWYKDGKEFFRHVPRDLEQKRQFPMPGVDVESSDESGSSLTLAPAVQATAGRYRCEVSGERPLFPTVSDHADLMVVELPPNGPAITGFQSQYRVGDRVQVTCTSGGSRPATRLAWYVNGEPASSLMVLQPVEIEGPSRLISSSLSLDFVLGEEHFKDGVVKIKCLATLGTVYWRSNEEYAQRKFRDHAVINVKRQAYSQTEDLSSNANCVYCIGLLVLFNCAVLVSKVL